MRRAAATAAPATRLRLITSLREMQILGDDLRSRGRIVTLVPTMGALHEGHLSLMRQALSAGDELIVSIFVNPAQFGPGEDFARYPRDFGRDFELLRELAPQALFAPLPEEMYPPDFGAYVDPGHVAEPWEGASRPGHFRGVATVVLKLLNLVSPDLAYFGQKDLQQAAVIRRMAQDFSLNTRVVVCPTVREPDGLAMSSRNAYLGDEDRRAAPVIYRSLRRAREWFGAGEARARALLEAIKTGIRSEPRVKLDYAAIVNPASMESVEHVTRGTAALVAARLGPARLIDNLIFGKAGDSDEELIDLAFGLSVRKA